jgi:hypothetical protein
MIRFKDCSPILYPPTNQASEEALTHHTNSQNIDVFLTGTIRAGKVQTKASGASREDPEESSDKYDISDIRIISCCRGVSFHLYLSLSLLDLIFLASSLSGSKAEYHMAGRERF